MKKILVTGFRPFGGQNINPSEQIINSLTAPSGTSLTKLILPVEFRESERILTEAAEKVRPDCILSLGQAGNSPCMAVERLAVNMDSSLSADGRTVLPDESGYAPIDTPIFTGGPAAYFSTLPVRAMAEALNKDGIPARVSYSAGTYVCNHVMYTGCSLAERYDGMCSGFVHVPFLPEQLSAPSGTGGRYSMPFSDMLRGIQIILTELANPL
ncbi:MAG: pyroglutamyl-peptidase I [Eubacteriales bacterium]